MKKNKIGRNSRCPCESGKKYKVCCLRKDEDAKRFEKYKYSIGQDTSTDHVTLMMEYFGGEYKDHKIIDISDGLNDENYRLYQTKNYNEKLIMIAEKNNTNQSVFKGRGPPNNDIIIMYRGSYRTFMKNDLENVFESIDKMIQTRLEGKDDCK